MLESCKPGSPILAELKYSQVQQGKVYVLWIQGFSESLHQAESVERQALHVYLCTLYV